MFAETFIVWAPGYRIIPSRFPSVYLYDRVANQEDFDLLNELEAMTNPRIRDQNGDLALVPDAERIFGNGAGPIMAAFTHLNPLGSRFSDGSYGVFYAAKERETAIAETRFHSANFLRATNEDPIYLQMRLYHVRVEGKVSDLMDVTKSHPELLAKTSYARSQEIGKEIRQQGSHGLIYPSVRYDGGSCMAAFRTMLLRDCLHAAYLEYHWNGREINYVTEKIG